MIASELPGFIGIEAEGSEAEGQRSITVSWWADEAPLLHVRDVVEHRVAQRLGRDRWYAGYRIAVARIGRAWAHGAPVVPDR